MLDLNKCDDTELNSEGWYTPRSHDPHPPAGSLTDPPPRQHLQQLKDMSGPGSWWPFCGPGGTGWRCRELMWHWSGRWPSLCSALWRSAREAEDRHIQPPWTERRCWWVEMSPPDGLMRTGSGGNVDLSSLEVEVLCGVAHSIQQELAGLWFKSSECLMSHPALLADGRHQRLLPHRCCLIAVCTLSRVNTPHYRRP